MSSFPFQAKIPSSKGCLYPLSYYGKNSKRVVVRFRLARLSCSRYLLWESQACGLHRLFSGRGAKKSRDWKRRLSASLPTEVKFITARMSWRGSHRWSKKQRQHIGNPGRRVSFRSAVRCSRRAENSMINQGWLYKSCQTSIPNARNLYSTCQSGFADSRTWIYIKLLRGNESFFLQMLPMNPFPPITSILRTVEFMVSVCNNVQNRPGVSLFLSKYGVKFLHCILLRQILWNPCGSYHRQNIFRFDFRFQMNDPFEMDQWKASMP